jgi:hypothetical protein
MRKGTPLLSTHLLREYACIRRDESQGEAEGVLKRTARRNSKKNSKKREGEAWTKQLPS